MIEETHGESWKPDLDQQMIIQVHESGLLSTQHKTENIEVE